MDSLSMLQVEITKVLKDGTEFTEPHTFRSMAALDHYLRQVKNYATEYKIKMYSISR
jgi:hypothetical protein